MSHNTLELKEGAFLLSDAHYSHRREELLDFIKAIHSKTLLPTQLILMGDIFDALFGGINYTYIENREMIRLLNDISQEIEVVYLEGNHDFNLQKIFPNVKVFSLSQQPIKVRYKNQIGFISHGDVFSGVGYRLFHVVIRNSFILKMLNFFLGKKLSKYYLTKTNSKKICKKINNFDKIAKQKIDLYDIGLSEVDFIIEGHYHQGLVLEQKCLYFNLKSYGCDKKYYQIKGDKITLI